MYLFSTTSLAWHPAEERSSWQMNAYSNWKARWAACCALPEWFFQDQKQGIHQFLGSFLWYFMIFPDFFNGDTSKILNAALCNKHGIGLIAVDQQQLGWQQTCISIKARLGSSTGVFLSLPDDLILHSMVFIHYVGIKTNRILGHIFWTYRVRGSVHQSAGLFPGQTFRWNLQIWWGKNLSRLPMSRKKEIQWMQTLKMGNTIW